MRPPALVVFDMAGTTIRDNGEVSRAFAAALDEHGIGVTPAQIKALRGASKRDAVLALIPEGPERTAAAERVYADFVRRLSAEYQQGARAVDGAESLFASLRAADVKVALNTGFDREITNLLIEALRWDGSHIDAVVCGDDVTNGRPAPDLILAAMAATGVREALAVANVGDTILDLRAGAAAGVGLNIGVLSGAHDRALLERAPHTCLVESVAGLAPILL